MRVPLRIVIRAAALICLAAAVMVLALSRLAQTSGPQRLAWALAGGCWMAVCLLAAYVLTPRVDFSGRTIARLPAGQGRLALTFDDGPNEPFTSRLLSTLARHGVRATFFLVGEAVRRSPASVATIVEGGHAIGNHSLTHSILTLASRSRLSREIAATQDVLEQAGARPPRLFRAPHGFKSLLWGALLDRLGLTVCAWTRGAWDTDNPPASVIAGRVLSRLSDGEIILLHDGFAGADRSATVAALEIILPECQRRGFRFVTLEEIVS